MNLDWHPEKLMAEVDQKLNMGLSILSTQVKSAAKDTCPVKTGALKASIRDDLKIEEKATYIGSDLDYSVWVELGTQKKEANPFLRRALDRAQEFWYSIFS